MGVFSLALEPGCFSSFMHQWEESYALLTRNSTASQRLAASLSARFKFRIENTVDAPVRYVLGEAVHTLACARRSRTHSAIQRRCASRGRSAPRLTSRTRTSASSCARGMGSTLHVDIEHK
jgi:hypothetical protein